ncbi:hypothetical protein L1887_05523 [Cichorium endivia]|nr:hypothetical protein L1887_05523 [Cichorium endivia]
MRAKWKKKRMRRLKRKRRKMRQRSNLVCLVFCGIFKPIQALGRFLGPKQSSSSSSAVSVGNNVDGDDDIEHGGGVAHHSPTQVLKNIEEIRFLKIELPSGKLGIEDNVLLKWKGDFESNLDNCMMLDTSSVIHSENFTSNKNNYNGVCGTGNGIGVGIGHGNNGSIT